MTEAMTRTLVEALMMWVVALSLTGVAVLGVGVGLAARMSGNMDEDKITSPGPPIGGEVAHGVACDASMGAMVGSPP